jgi:hypothetical protein
MDTALDSVLRDFDARTTPFTESDVAEAMRACLQGSADVPRSVAATAEVIAFNVCEEYSNREFGWGSYYGPMYVGPGKTGGLIEWPSIQLVTPEILEYWLRRASEATNPILKLRYSDIAWDLWPGRHTSRRPIAAAQSAIDETVKLLSGPELQHTVTLIKKARRGLSLAIQTNDAERIRLVAAAMIDFEELIAKDEGPGLWGFCLDELVLNDKVALEPAQEVRIVSGMEERLAHVSTPGLATFNAFATEALVLGLRPYYRKKAPDKIANLLQLYLQAFRSAAANANDGLTASDWLAKVARVLRQEGRAADADALEPEIRSYAEKARDSLKPISVEGEVSNQKIEDYLQMMVGSTLEEALTHIAIRFVPRKGEISDLKASLVREFPISQMATKTIVDQRGMAIAELPPYFEDPDSHLMQQIGENMSHSGLFLDLALERALEKYLGGRIEGIAEYFAKAGLFTPHTVAFLKTTLRAYDEQRWIDCIHCMVPMIEALVRRHVEVLGGALYVPRRKGPKGFMARQLDDLLRDGRLHNFWQSEEVPLYLRVLLTDVLGWNLRNRICHGEFALEGFTQTIANQLLHAVLVLGQVRRIESSPDKSGGEPPEMKGD